mmetsp:Transcript_22536/g.72621  ORF Transcript_22536/g.72621 Transcript_22536/m.72621 type:complete len:498 (-) Transcript_22536:334-1827(-)
MHGWRHAVDGGVGRIGAERAALLGHDGMLRRNQLLHLLQLLDLLRVELLLRYLQLQLLLLQLPQERLLLRGRTRRLHLLRLRARAVRDARPLREGARRRAVVASRKVEDVVRRRVEHRIRRRDGAVEVSALEPGRRLIRTGASAGLRAVRSRRPCPRGRHRVRPCPDIRPALPARGRKPSAFRRPALGLRGDGGEHAVLRYGALDLDALPVEVVKLVGAHAVNARRVVVRDEAEAARLSCVGVAHDDAVRHPAVRLEIRDELELARLVRQAADKDLELARPHLAPDRGSRHRRHAGHDGSDERWTRQAVRVARHGRLGLDLLAVYQVTLRDDVISDVLVAVGDEAKAARPAGEVVVHDDRVSEGAEVLEEDAERGLRDVVAEPTRKALEASAVLVVYRAVRSLPTAVPASVPASASASTSCADPPAADAGAVAAGVAISAAVVAGRSRLGVQGRRERTPLDSVRLRNDGLGGGGVGNRDEGVGARSPSAPRVEARAR